jgi:ribonuclease BN (tRNA processing enzyme)
MQIRFWGTRGSIPVPGKSTLKYGGNTPCIEVRSSSGKLLILDAGSGIRELGNELAADNSGRDIDIIFSHYHWDHIQGLPFFKPLYHPDSNFNFYGIVSNNMGVREVLENQMMPNNFPITLDKITSNKKYININNHSFFKLDTIAVETFQSNHPSPTLVFKLTEGERFFVYVTDNEIYLDETNDSGKRFSKLNLDLVEFCKGADYLVHDVMFDEQSFLKSKGWGHSGNVSAAEFSIAAGVKNLIFFHYNPDYSDEKIDQLLLEVQRIFTNEKVNINCIGSREGLTFTI